MRAPHSIVALGLTALGLAALAQLTMERSARAFDLDDVAEKARQLAARPYAPPQTKVPKWLLDLNYEKWRDIRFRPEKALWRDRKLPFTIQFFHPGYLYDRTVQINVVTRSGISPVKFSPEDFDYGHNQFEGRVPQDLGFAGFRVHYPIKTRRYQDEVTVFLGASYFRAVGRDEVYGLSARGVAIDTALPSGEEFPWFREYWLVRPGGGAQELTLFALLDSPSLTGAYRFVIAPGPETRVDVELRLFLRTPIHKLGIAPLTSMFLRGENDLGKAFDDYRPEVHDSDGLLLASRSGEWLWRPLDNPENLSVSDFEAANPIGFGLLQRDRVFDHYQDFSTRSDLRPSTWVKPRGDWGPGHVELVEIPTPDDTNDNIVAYWVPETPASPGPPVSFAYSIWWYGKDHSRPPGGWTAATRSDSGSVAGARRLLVDFDSPALRRLPADAVVEGVVSAVVDDGKGGQKTQPAELLEQTVIRNPVNGSWRLVFQVKPPGDDAVELRAYLRHGPDAITETWSYLLVP